MSNKIQPLFGDKNLEAIFIIDELPPEAIAMVQALYSRDPRSVVEHLKKVKETGPEKFMARFYAGYGHKSIGDCGTTTVCAENITMLAAKALQQWPLYNGQEASTRYLDFANSTIINPLGDEKGKVILEGWMNLYNRVLEILAPNLKVRFPIKEGEDPKIYEKAIKAKGFDIARGFLPAAATTMVAWHTNLRQAQDHLKIMRHHPLAEVRQIASSILTSLRLKYPSSFSHKVYEEEEKYIDLCQGQIGYSDLGDVEGVIAMSYLKKDKIKEYSELFKKRPGKAELPNELRNCGDIDFRFKLDFGSFRDIQRHRSMVCTMPLLTTKFGFHPWYLEQLPSEHQKEIVKEIARLKKLIEELDCDPTVAQYYIAMGYQVSLEITCNLPSAVYIAELRSSITVHPTLRLVAQETAIILEKHGIPIYNDKSPDEFSIKRGTQDIIEKNN